MSDLEAGRRRIARLASAVSQEATARSNDLLIEIEDTLDVLELTTDVLTGYEKSISKATAKLANAGCPLDPQGMLNTLLEKAAGNVNELYNDLIERRESARADDRLQDEDGLEDAFTSAIASAADLFNSLEDLRFVVAENDVSCDEEIADKAALFSDPDKLRAYLQAL